MWEWGFLWRGRRRRGRMGVRGLFRGVICGSMRGSRRMSCVLLRSWRRVGVFLFFFFLSPLSFFSFFFLFFFSLSLSLFFAHGLIFPGDGFIMLASCYHGGGANTTTDEERLLYSCFMTRGWLRQEENHYLNMGLDKVKTLPREIQDICGYALSEPFLGWVNSTTPRVVLDPSIQVCALFLFFFFLLPLFFFFVLHAKSHDSDCKKNNNREVRIWYLMHLHN